MKGQNINPQGDDDALCSEEGESKRIPCSGCIVASGACGWALATKWDQYATPSKGSG